MTDELEQARARLLAGAPSPAYRDDLELVLGMLDRYRQRTAEIADDLERLSDILDDGLTEWTA